MCKSRRNIDMVIYSQTLVIYVVGEAESGAISAHEFTFVGFLANSEVEHDVPVKTHRGSGTHMGLELTVSGHTECRYRTVHCTHHVTSQRLT